MLVSKEEVLVIGDDFHSEMRAAGDLGMDAVLYDHFRQHEEGAAVPKIGSFR